MRPGHHVHVLHARGRPHHPVHDGLPLRGRRHPRASFRVSHPELVRPQKLRNNKKTVFAFSRGCPRYGYLSSTPQYVTAGRTPLSLLGKEIPYGRTLEFGKSVFPSAVYRCAFPSSFILAVLCASTDATCLRLPPPPLPCMAECCRCERTAKCEQTRRYRSLGISIRNYRISADPYGKAAITPILQFFLRGTHVHTRLSQNTRARRTDFGPVSTFCARLRKALRSDTGGVESVLLSARDTRRRPERSR